MTTSIPVLSLLLSLTLAIAPAVCGAKVYQWIDADGNVQFSDRPQEPIAGQIAQQGTEHAKQTREDRELTVRVVPVDFSLHDRIRSMLESIPRAVHQIYRTRLGLNPPGPSTLTIRLFPDQSAYDRLVGSVADRAEPNGYAASNTDELAIWYRSSPDAMAQCLAGETNSALLRSRFPFTPYWLREGLTHYVQLLRVLGDTTAVFPDPHLDQTLQALHRAGTLLPTARLLTLSEPEWQQENQPDQRAAVQSWSLVYFLLSTPGGGPLVGEILKRSETAAGADPSASVAVIDARFAGGVEALDRRWCDWITTYKAAHYY